MPKPKCEVMALSNRYPGRSRLLLLVVSLAALLPASPAVGDVDDDYNLALQFYKQDRWELAGQKLQEFLESAPADHGKVPLAKLYLGQALVHQRKFAEARPVFRDFVASYPGQEDIPLAMYRVAECSYFVDDFKAARQELTAFLRKVTPDNPLAEWALQYLGETELQLEDYAAARKAFETGLRQFEGGRLNSEMRFGLARALDGLNQSEDARKLYQQIAGEDGPRAADAQFNLAARLFEDKQFQQSAEQFAAITTRFADHKVVPLATLNAGYSYYHLGDYDRAMQHFAKVRTDPKHGPAAEYWIGLSQKSLEQWDAAADTLLGQFAKDDQQPLAESLLFHAADARLRKPDYAEAIRLFRDVHRRWPTGDMADDSLHLATEAAILSSDFELARSFDEQFSREFPQSGLRLPQDLLSGRLLLLEGDQLAKGEGTDPEEARRKYRSAAEAFTRVLNASQIAETQSLARLQLSRAWDRLENHEQVLQTLKPLVDEATQANASEQAVIALVMQSTALLSLERYQESITAAEAFLEKRSSGAEVAEALANLSLSHAHLGQWEPAKVALERLRGTGNRSLADRVSYEMAEAAFDTRQWSSAVDGYRAIVEQGPQGEFYRPAISGLAYSLHEQGRELNEQVSAAESAGEAATSLLAQAVRLFNESGQWFSRLAELSGQQGDRVIQSDAMYMQGLSQRLARKLPEATATFMQTARQFAIPPDNSNPDQTELKAAYNAFRSAKEAARGYQQTQQTAEADEAYQLAFDQLKQQPAEAQTSLDTLINEWALLHYNAGDFARANTLFAKLVEERPQSEWADDARMLLAESDYFDGKYPEARDAFRSLLAEDSTDDFVRERSLILLMDIAARLDDWADVRTTAETLVARFPEGGHRWEALYRQGEAALQQGQLEEARTIFEQLRQQQDDAQIAAEEWYPGVWLMLAETHLRLKEHDKVDQIADEFDQLHPDSPLAYHLDDVRGRSLKQRALFDEARAAFQQVIDSPQGKGTETAAKAQLFIAECHLLQDDYEQAFEDYYRVLLYGFPEWQAMALYQAGQCEEQLKRWQGAARSYRQLLEDHPQSEYAEKARLRLADLEKRFPDTVAQ